MTSMLSEFGSRMTRFLYQVGQIWILLLQILRVAFRPPFYFRLTIEQIYFVGIKSFSLLAVTAASTGMVMALQFGLGLEKFGGKLYVPKLVSLSIVREIGPVFCSLMMAARVGSGIASEIGSMVVTQQIDAIRALGTSPIKRIIIPRILGCVISLPLLTAFGDLIGVFGGLMVGKHELDLDPGFYLEKVFATITVTDYLTGIGKTFFFAFFIGLVSCYYGMNVSGGTRGVGMTTTKSVVVSSIAILISDFFLTKLFFVFFEV